MEVCNEKEEKYFVWINIGIGEEMGYFRNKLNRIPKNINELKKKSGNWKLLKVGTSTYHMHPSDFSGKTDCITLSLCLKTEEMRVYI